MPMLGIGRLNVSMPLSVPSRRGNPIRTASSFVNIRMSIRWAEAEKRETCCWVRNS